RLAEHDPACKYRCNCTGSSRESGCRYYVTDVSRHTVECRTTVESEPAEPQDEHTKRSEREVVTRDSLGNCLATNFCVLAKAGTNDYCTSECQPCTYTVYD